jgi:LCP family protein required for cell wall assembly
VTEWLSPPVPAARRRRVAVYARRGSKTVFGLVSVAVLALTWYGWQVIGDPTTGLTTTPVFADNSVHAIPLDGAIDILLVGQDSRTDAQGNPLPREVLDMLHAGEADGERQTDTMILVHIPQNGQHAVAISFPRDSYVDITGGFGKHKLNSAYVYAYNDTSKTLQRQGAKDLKDVDEKSKLAGRKNLIATLEQFMGKPGMIDRYAEVNLSSFYEITRAIGGVDVCLNHAVKEEKSGVDLPAGQQPLQGVQALAFVRQRYGLPNGDLDRIARQQAFLSGLAAKVLSSDTLTNPVRIADLVSAVKKSVVLSEGWDLAEFAAQMRGLTGGNIQFHTIPTEGNAVIGGADVLRVDPVAVRAMVNQLTTDATSTSPGASTTTTASAVPGADAVTVDVFDGTGARTLDTTTQNALHGRGFSTGSSAKLSPRATTVLRYAPGDAAAADLVKQMFGASVTAEPDKDVTKGHVRILLGKDFQGLTTPGTSAVSSSVSSSVSVSSSSSQPLPKPITAGGVPCVN